MVLQQGEGRTYSFLAGNPSPHVRARVVARRLADTTSLDLVLAGNLLELLLDIGEAVEGDVRDIVFLAMLLETQAAACEEDVRLAGSGKVRDAVADEHDQGHFVRTAHGLGLSAALVDGARLVVACVGVVVTPDGLPLRTVHWHDAFTGDDINRRGLERS